MIRQSTIDKLHDLRLSAMSDALNASTGSLRPIRDYP